MKNFAEFTLKFGSFFTCGGGSSIGAIMAGLKDIFACDINPVAKKVFEANRHIFGDALYLNADVRALQPDELLKTSGLHPGELDLLEASPPCKFISRTNPQARWDHPMNFLYRELFKHMTPTGIYPKVAVMENVDALLDKDFKPLYDMIISEARLLNYNFVHGVLNAKYYGVPQSRKRVIFIFVRKDIGIYPELPDPIGHVIPISDVIPGIIGFSDSNYGKGFNYKSSVCRTLTTSDSLLFHFKCRIRKPTIEERKAIMTFPANYILPVSKTAALDILGNAVPPMLMCHIIETIKKNILLPYYEHLKDEKKGSNAIFYHNNV